MCAGACSRPSSLFSLFFLSGFGRQLAQSIVRWNGADLCEHLDETSRQIVLPARAEVSFGGEFLLNKPIA